MELRPYQSESIDSLRHGFKSGHKKQVLCAATGAGKSVIMLEMIRSALAKGSTCLFLCERRILVEQFSAHLDAAGIEHGVLMSKHYRWRPWEKVQVASAQTLEKMASWPKFDVVFIDELHASMRKSVINLFKIFPETKVVGATATPFNPKIGEHFTNVTNVITMSDLVNSKHLVPFRVFAAKEIDLKGLKIGFDGEFEKAGLESRAITIIGDVVSDYVRTSMQVYGELRKGIVFSSGIAHGTELMRKFQESGINAVQISANDDDEFKADVLSNFKRADTDIKLVISSMILERGFDQADIDIVILAKAIKKSFSSLVQMVGRGARPHPGKEYCVVIDHGCNWLRHSKQWEKLYHEGVKELSSEPDKTKKPEPTEREKKASECPKCHAISSGNPCMVCGYAKPVKSAVEAVAGEMVELSNPKSKAKLEFTPEQKQKWYSELLFLEMTWKVKQHYAYAQFISKFGHKPHGYSKSAKPASGEVISWAKSRFIANKYRASK